jgi:hypothetical protein
MVQARLHGFLPPNFNGTIPQFDARRPPPWLRSQSPPMEIHDARPLQARAVSEADFFEENAFVLLGHETMVADWDRDAVPVYFPEIDQLVRRRLLPGTRLEIQQPYKPIRRGRGTRTPQYGLGVHSDIPLTPELYARNFAAFGTIEAGKNWYERYQRDDVAGFVSIDFWRTTNMLRPLRHMPLALCAPASVDRKDIVPISARGVGGDRPSDHLALRFNPAQQWYFYSAMTAGEVLAFKMCEFWKDDPGAHPQSCFHCAFHDPDTPADAEQRQSCEHRVGVLILKD